MVGVTPSTSAMRTRLVKPKKKQCILWLSAWLVDKFHWPLLLGSDSLSNQKLMYSKQRTVSKGLAEHCCCDILSLGACASRRPPLLLTAPCPVTKCATVLLAIAS